MLFSRIRTLRAGQQCTQKMDKNDDAEERRDGGAKDSAGSPETFGQLPAREDSEPDPNPSFLPPGPSSAGDTGAESGRKKKKNKKKKKDDLGSTRGIETMFRSSYRVHMDLSSLADAKANIMISINGIIISIIIAAISPKIDTNPWLLVPTSIMLLGSLVSIVYAVRAARPRVSSELVDLEDVASNRANILFFGHFTRMSEDDYVSGMTNLLANPTALYYNMIRDIYGLGTVLARKFELLRVSYTVFMYGLVIGIALFLAVYVWIVVSIGAA